MTPKISIVIPSYNKKIYISRSIESILRQSYKNFEIIIQDGKSTDGTVEIIKEFANKYPKIIIWESKKDGGQLDAVIKGIKKSTGDILAFLNADDVYLDNTFEKIAHVYDKHKSSLWFIGKGKVINQMGKEITKPFTVYKNFLLKNFSFTTLLITNFIYQPSVFITRKAYFKYGPFIGTKDFILEYDLWLKLARNKKPVVINSVLSMFRIYPNTKSKLMTKKILAHDEKIVKKYTNNPIVLFLHSLHNHGRVLIGKFI